MTKKQELKELKNIASGQIPLKGANRLPYEEEILAAKAELAVLEEKDNKSKARFLIFNEGKQKELRRRLKEIALAKRREAEKKRMAARILSNKQANKIINDFATEHKLKD